VSDPGSATAFDLIAKFLMSDRQGSGGLQVRDRLIAQLGCSIATDPDGPEIANSFREALTVGMTAEALEALLIHAIGYVGVPVARAAFAVFNAELERAGVALLPGNPSIVDPDRNTRVQHGARLYDRFDPGRQAAQERKFAPLSPIYYSRAMELSGLVLASAAVPLRERQIMTVAMLSCLGGQAEQLRFHIGVALRNGVELGVLAGVLLLVQVYAGMPRANSSASLAIEVLGESAGAK
jgi:4-carboxymuconolactone decarboxylase